MKATSYEDFRRAARRRIPRVAFDYLDGGSGSEIALRESVDALDRLRFLPRALVNVDRIDVGKSLFGRRYAVPFGIAPIGLAGLIWPGADRMLWDAAIAADMPYVLSTAATTAVETAVPESRGHAWFQLYVARDESVADDLMDRANALDIDVLFVTVDVPVPGRRLRDMRSGLGLPLRPSLRLAADVAMHPAWCLALARGGAPRLQNIERYADPGATAGQIAAFMATQSSGRLDWTVLKHIRDRWPRKLVVKGIVSPEDAVRARDAGADGIVVSTHGGRQLNSTIASIDALAAVRRAVGPGFPVLLDSGVRSGEHVAKALALGADFVLMGRLPLMAIAGGGPGGLTAALDMVKDDLARTLALLGVASVDDLSEAVFAPGSRSSDGSG
ncbi:alpha-hydroxy acid oxidase [Amorphus sp. MBR-141]